MQSLFLAHEKLSKEREEYLKEYQEFEDKKTQKTKEVLEIQVPKKSATKLTLDDLLNYGKDLDKEYENVANDSNINRNRRHGSIPVDLIEYAFTLDTKEVSRLWHKKEENYGHAKDNIKKVYKICIEKLNELGIDIYDIKKELTNFQNRMTSSVCGGTTTYTFYCKKNKYSFAVEFIDDCDCDPGLLYIREVIHNDNATVYNMHCDLFCQNNTSKFKLQRFMIFLDSSNEEQFVANISQKFYDLIYLIENSNSGDLEITNKKISSDAKNIIDDNFHFELALKIKDTKCMLYLYDSYDELYIGPTIYPNYPLAFGDHDMYQQPDPKHFKVGYNSKKDFEKIYACITKYINFQNNEFGYLSLSDNVWYNHNTVVDYISKCNYDKEKCKVYCDYQYDNKSGFNQNGPDIDVTVYLIVGKNYTPLYYKSLENKFTNKYPVEFYNMNIYYNKASGSDCKLTVDGFYHYLNFTNDYHFNRSEFIRSCSDIINKHIIGKYETCGEFDKIFNEVKIFIDTLTK